MGKTAFSGPVYGAKSLLFAASFTTGSTGASTHLEAKTVVAPYEDWYITEFKASASTNSTTGQSWYLKSEGGSSGLPRYQGQPSTVAQTIATINAGGSSNVNAIATVVPTAGEYEGMYVPAGSTVRIVSSGAGAPSFVNLSVMGYVRFVNSTRSE
ncbi:MAG TPA: hypothetical protein VIV12_21870 [Streptosporangiaceae bacterium]